MKTWVQLAVVVGISAAAASATYLRCGPPDRRVPCDAGMLRRADEVCLDRVTGEWGGKVLWVDARGRGDWERDGVSGSLWFGMDAGEDMNDVEARAAARLVAAERVVVYCASEGCGTSGQVADRIRSMGLGPQVYVLHGGWQALRAGGLIKGSK